MEAVYDRVLGKIEVPEFSKVVYLPYRSVGKRPAFQVVATAVVRDGKTGKATQAAYGFGLVPTDGLFGRWRADEKLQQLYQTPDDYVKSFSEQLRRLAKYASKWPLSPYLGGNERVDNGANMVMKLQYNVSSPTHTPSFPTFMGLCNLSSFAAAHGDLSIGSASPDVTTNEFTNHGLARTSALTPAPTTPNALDAQYTITIANTFTESSGPDTVYGGAMFDAAPGTSNMFMEYAFTGLTLNTGDTLTVTETAKG